MDNAAEGRIWPYEYHKILVVKVQVLLWNKVGVEQVAQTLKQSESLKHINNPID